MLYHRKILLCLTIYTGVGAFAARWQSMRAAALRTAEAYYRISRGPGDIGGVGGEPDVRVVAAGLEPLAFTHLFDVWLEHDEAADANIAVSLKYLYYINIYNYIYMKN